MMFHSLFSSIDLPEAAGSLAARSRVGARRACAAMAAALVALALAGATGCAAPASDSSNQTGADAASQQASMSVNVVVDTSAVEGAPVSYDAPVTLDEGASAFDALQATGLSVNVTESSYGSYVSAVEGLAAGDHGDMSGWMYEVNGAEAQVAASAYVLSKGDSVRWYYTVS
ncbi:DUF4430 domain-containing protein [Enteroscipio rubneri]|uniref:DUF4430 domain-containing protein n=1 Tax=Enteroscipio rubneri TaxID=2070686 RepID=UPI00320A1BC3